MNRKLIITIHLALAAFFTPTILIVVISGGLYLLGEKGEVASEILYRGEMESFTFEAEDKAGEVNQFLKENGIEHDFEYIKDGDGFMLTRPTSKTHLLFEREKNQLIVSKQIPNFIAAIIEVHKGHGPVLLKQFQKILALGLIVILLTGFYLGITSPLFKLKTIAISGAGLVTFLYLALV